MLSLPVRPSAWNYLARVDPRLRVFVAVGLSVMIALATQPRTALAGLAIALSTAPICGIRPGTVLRRLAGLNVLMLLLVGVLPLTTPGHPVAYLGPWPLSAEGLQLGCVIALQGNAILILLLTLLGTLDPIVLGHALSHFRVPDKLTHLLLFTVRYFDVLHSEYLRLRAAMKVRGFRPRMNRHTYRSLGHLVGMLLVRSHDRAERIAGAMKCRGFRGRFHLFDHFVYTWVDLPFALASLGAMAALGGMLWVRW